MSKFKAGQSVRLKGQPTSPIMTISENFSYGNYTKCVFWKSDTNYFKRERFEDDCLELVPDSEIKALMKSTQKVQ